MSILHDWTSEKHLFLSLSLLLEEVTFDWIIPTLVLIQLGSLAAAELATLTPLYRNLMYGRFVGVTDTEPRQGIWTDDYKVYDSINLALALAFLASAVRTRWLRDTTELQQKLRQPLITPTNDERVEMVA